MRATTPTADAHELEPLRLAILRRVAAVVRAAGLDEHEIDCVVQGELADLSVVLAGPALAESVMQALRVRVLDAVHADGRTFGRVDVTFRFDVATA